jgi:hypothetical protein
VRPRTIARFSVPAFLLVLLGGPAATAAATGPGQGPEQIQTTVTLTNMEMMLGAKDDFTRWDLSAASGSYVQVFGDRTLNGRIIDLGALQLPDGTTYPMLMAEGHALVVRTEAGPQTVGKVSNTQDLVLAPKETVWRAPDGKTTVLLARGVFYLVLDPKGFPENKKVIGIADSKTLFLYPTK